MKMIMPKQIWFLYNNKIFQIFHKVILKLKIFYFTLINFKNGKYIKCIIIIQLLWKDTKNGANKIYIAVFKKIMKNIKLNYNKNIQLFN